MMKALSFVWSQCVHRCSKWVAPTVPWNEPENHKVSNIECKSVCAIQLATLQYLVACKLDNQTMNSRLRLVVYGHQSDHGAKRSQEGQLVAIYL